MYKLNYKFLIDAIIYNFMYCERLIFMCIHVDLEGASDWLFQATMAWLGLSTSNGTRASMIIFAVTFFLLILTLTSSFGQFQWFSKAKILIGRSQNMTTEKDLAYQGNITFYNSCFILFFLLTKIVPKLDNHVAPIRSFYVA